MADIECLVLPVETVDDHPNADRLSLVRVQGYNFICISAKLEDKSHRYKPGDLVVYIPEAALLPPWLLKKLEFWDPKEEKGTLNGTKGNRVKAIRLRGVVSQGILYECLGGKLQNQFKTASVEAGDDAQLFLGIQKYEPEATSEQKEKMHGDFFNSGYVLNYDIDSILKYKDLIQDQEPVEFTEKIHGTNFQITFLPKDQMQFKKKKRKTWCQKVKEYFKPEPNELQERLCVYDFNGELQGELLITSKGQAAKGLALKYNAKNISSNVYMRTCFQDNLVYKMQMLALRYPGKSVTLIGEIFGNIQDLKYGIPVGAESLVFDVLVQNEYLNRAEVYKISEDFNIKLVPILYKGPFSKEVELQHRDGKTVVGGNHIREGIVIRPAEERFYRDKRVILKSVSPDYLLRKNGTELQ